jgi:CubicO group peptidase (beta-lactamase class C family)
MRLRRKPLALAAILLSGTAAGWAQPNLSGRIKDIVEAEARYAGFSGVVLVARNDDVVYRGAFGLASREFEVPNTLATRFDIGSITKTFTALGIMVLVEQGRINVDDPLSKYLPDCPVPEKNEITIHQLLTHTSGLYDYANDEGVVFETLFKKTTSDLVPYVYGPGLLSPPGREVHYSSGGYVLLGAVIEKISGMSYSRYLEENILKPAGMSSTALLTADDVCPNKAVGYKRLDREKYANRSLWQFPGSPAGGLVTTVDDLFRYVQALLGEKLLSAEYRAQLLGPKGKDDPDRGTIAYAWWIDRVGNQKVIYHGGGTPGFSSSLYVFPELKCTAIVLSNCWRGTTGVTDLINSALAGISYEIADENTYDLRRGIDLFYAGRNSEARRLLDPILEGSKPARRAYYYAAAARLAENMDIQKAIDYLGRYIALTDPQARSSLATAWFKKGQAYEKLKDTAEAARCYEQSLKLNPENEPARKALAEIGRK